MLVRFASCASLLSFCEVLWMPNPIREARFANSECCDAPAPLIRGLKPAGHEHLPETVYQGEGWEGASVLCMCTRRAAQYRSQSLQMESLPPAQPRISVLVN